MEKIKYKNDKLGKATEIIAKIMCVAIVVPLAIWWFFEQVIPQIKIALEQTQNDMVISGVLASIIAFVLVITIFILLFRPLVGLHKSTMLFVSHKISRQKYRNRRIWSVVVLSLLCLPSGLLVISVLFNSWLFWQALFVLLLTMPLMPFWIFLVRTKSLLKQREQEEMSDNSIQEKMNTDKNEEKEVLPIHNKTTTAEIENKKKERANIEGFTHKWSKIKFSMGRYLKTLNHSEIIIASVVVGAIVALILGYAFGNTTYYLGGNRVSYEVFSRRTGGVRIFEFNYLLGLLSFVISGGITYLFLKKKPKETKE